MDIAPGQVKFKQGGGDAGHKGLKSIIAALGSYDVKRLRIGVRKGDNARNTKTSVLRSFSSSDKKTLESDINKAVGILLREIKNSDNSMANLAHSDRKTNNGHDSTSTNNDFS